VGRGTVRIVEAGGGTVVVVVEALVVVVVVVVVDDPMVGAARVRRAGVAQAAAENAMNTARAARVARRMPALVFAVNRSCMRPTQIDLPSAGAQATGGEQGSWSRWFS
jgi:hypothetical protein